jgi:predicted benzoate:H+ symporter BenE
MAFGSRSGGFDSLSWHGFGSEVAFELTMGLDGVTVTVTAVPEPATWASLLAGLALIGAWRLRRQAPMRGKPVASRR